MKTAIITGASGGIGRAAAARFAKEGYRVHNLSRRPCPVAGVENIAVDFADDAATVAAANALVDALGKTAVKSSSVALVHNACRMLKDSAADCPSDALRGALQVNVIAANAINQALLPVLPSTSSVLYIGSTLSEKAVAGTFSYAVSKHAVVGMMRATCQDLLGRGIHTACICPGFTDTEMLRTHLGGDPEALRAVAARNSGNRLIAPEEIADFILWAHENPVINGAVLHAHLGQREA